MSNVKVPGFLWVVAISVAIVLIETYVPSAYQLYGETAIVVLMGVAKAANLGTKEIEDLLAMLHTLQGTSPIRESASAQGVEEHRPNKWARWLVG